MKADYETRYEKKGRPRACYISHVISVCLAIERVKSEESDEVLQFKAGE